MILLWALAALPAAAAPLSADARGKNLSPAEKIRKELDQPLSVEIIDQPLHLALAQLREQTKISFVLDRQTLAQMNLDPEQSPVQVKFKDVKLRTVLRTMLSAHNLGYAIIGETIFVSSDDMVMVKQMQQRVSFDLDKIEFAAALKQLGRETATNLILDSRVAKEGAQPVSLQLDDVPLETAVRLLAEMTGLKPVRIGNVLFVTSKANAQEMRADPDLAPRANPAQPDKVELILPGAGGLGPGPANPMAPRAVPAAPANPPANEKPNDNPPAEKPAPKDKDK